MPISDDQIRGAVMSLFKKYDRDNTGYVQRNQITAMCNDLQHQLANKRSFSKEQVHTVLSSIDANQDGKVTKDQLFVLMKKLNG